MFCFVMFFPPVLTRMTAGVDAAGRSLRNLCRTCFEVLYGMLGYI